MVSNDDVNMIVEPRNLQDVYEVNYYGDFHHFTVTVPSGYRWRVRNIQVEREQAGDISLFITEYFSIDLKKEINVKSLYYEPMTAYWLPAGFQITGTCHTTGASGNEWLRMLYEQDIEY